MTRVMHGGGVAKVRKRTTHASASGDAQSASWLEWRPYCMIRVKGRHT